MLFVSILLLLLLFFGYTSSISVILSTRKLSAGKEKCVATIKSQKPYYMDVVECDDILKHYNTHNIVREISLKDAGFFFF